jgi:inner membrane protein
VAGLAGWRLHGGVRPALRLAAVFTALATFQDLDLLFPRGWGETWAHRGALHSPAVALAAAAIASLLPGFQGRRGWTLLLAFAVAASHGLLDTLTRGGAGVMLLWPLSLARFESPWQPLPASPFSVVHPSTRFFFRLLIEAILFSPVFLWAIWPRRALSAPAAPPPYDPGCRRSARASGSSAGSGR